MAKIETSQVKYLKGRKKNYNLKYAILNEVIAKEIDARSVVVELFGGIGITSKLIQSRSPLAHYVVELNQDCLEYLNKIPNIKIIEGDAFKVPKLACDIIFLDPNSFNFTNLPKYEKILKAYKHKTLVITETGCFNLKFNSITSTEHFARLADKLSRLGLNLARVYHTPNFSILVVKPSHKLIIEKWEDEWTGWKKLVG